MIDDDEHGIRVRLISQAVSLARPVRPSELCIAGSVAAVILTESGKEYTGVALEMACSLGSCAEHAAVTDMLKNLESRIRFVVAVHYTGKIFAPCGRCRELMWLVSPHNRNASIILGPNKAVPLHALLPNPWRP